MDLGPLYKGVPKTKKTERRCRRGQKTVRVGGGGAPDPSGLIYMRGLGVDWSGQTTSHATGDEADQHNAGVLDYNPTGQIRQDIIAMSTLLVNSIMGNQNRFFYDVGAGQTLMTDLLTGKIWAITHASPMTPRTFGDAQAEVDARNAAVYRGRKQWRIPTIKELMTIQFLEGGSGALSFIGLTDGTVWSATNYRNDPTRMNLTFDADTGLVAAEDRDIVAPVLLMIGNELA